nr:MAG TPA: hypothetical protein [Caudoviricetes sp.]
MRMNKNPTVWVCSYALHFCKVTSKRSYLVWGTKRSV